MAPRKYQTEEKTTTPEGRREYDKLYKREMRAKEREANQTVSNLIASAGKSPYGQPDIDSEYGSHDENIDGLNRELRVKDLLIEQTRASQKSERLYEELRAGLEKMKEFMSKSESEQIRQDHFFAQQMYMFIELSVFARHNQPGYLTHAENEWHRLADIFTVSANLPHIEKVIFYLCSSIFLGRFTISDLESALKSNTFPDPDVDIKYAQEKLLIVKDRVSSFIKILKELKAKGYAIPALFEKELNFLWESESNE